MNPIYESGIQFIQTLQSMSPNPGRFYESCQFLGTIDFYLILIPFLYWVVSAQLGFRVLLVLLSTDFLGVASKQLLRQPRPYWVGNVQALAEETSYGIPSTHASDTIAVWGYLVYKFNKAWLWVLTFLVVLLVGISRMYLGVHFPTDVLGGWLLGLVGIFLVVMGEKWLSPYLKKQSTGMLIGIGFLVSVGMILVGWLIGLLIASSPDPTEWAEYAAKARRHLALLHPGRSHLWSSRWLPVDAAVCSFSDQRGLGKAHWPLPAGDGWRSADLFRPGYAVWYAGC